MNRLLSRTALAAGSLAPAGGRTAGAIPAAAMIRTPNARVVQSSGRTSALCKRLLAVLSGGALLGGLGVSQAAPAWASATPYYGISLSELQVGAVGTATIQVAEAEVQAVHDAWHANTVRLQIEQDRLTGPTGLCPLAPSGCLPYYQQIKTVTNYALGLGLTVVINDTTLPAPGYTRNEPLPTVATEVFWRDIALAYSGNSRVIFDLFNEPRGLGGTGATQWAQWRNGGSSYLGMQTVLAYVRNTLRAPNAVWADGLDAAGTLNGIAPHAATGTVDGAPGSVGSYALSQTGDTVTGPLVYTFHHPMGYQTTTAWWRDFGYLHGLGYPVMDGEWNNAVDGGDYCWSEAPSTIPAYFDYLATRRIGLTAWELGPNVSSAGVVTWSQSRPFSYTNTALASSPASYETPSTISGDPPLPWDCANSNDAGSGQLVRNWFASQGG